MAQTSQSLVPSPISICLGLIERRREGGGGGGFLWKTFTVLALVRVGVLQTYLAAELNLIRAHGTIKHETAFSGVNGIYRLSMHVSRNGLRSDPYLPRYSKIPL